MPDSELARLVRDALGNLYDVARLQTHPLVDFLALRCAPGETRAEALRKVLRQAIEMLKPEASVPVGRQEWLDYRILWLRFVRCVEEADILKELNISESTLFRHQREAIDAISMLIDQKYVQPRQGKAERAEQNPCAVPEEAMERALTLASTGAGAIDLQDMVRDALGIVEALAAQQDINIQLDTSLRFPLIDGDPTLLRQVILSFLADGLSSSTGHTLEFGLSMSRGETILRLRWPTVSLRADEMEPAFATSRRLLSQYEGRLWFDRDASSAMIARLAIPISEAHSILVIDDDPSALDLYSRYLQNYGYMLLGARNNEAAARALAESRVDLIVLDVVLPNEDGWEVLQWLKKTPETAKIPVLVCSAFAQPELALALGATEVLGKPFSPEDFVQVIQKCLFRADNGVAKRPAMP